MLTLQTKWITPKVFGSHHVKEHEKLCLQMVLEIVCIFVCGHLSLRKDVLNIVRELVRMSRIPYLHIIVLQVNESITAFTDLIANLVIWISL